MTKLYLRSAGDVQRAVRAGKVVKLVQSWCEDAVTRRGPIVIDYSKPVEQRVLFNVGETPPPDCLTFFDESKTKSKRRGESDAHVFLRQYAINSYKKRGR